MTPALIFQLQLILGYVPWFLVFTAYVFPKLRSMDPAAAHRAIAMLHSFRFFGLAFIVPGVVGSGLPAGFAIWAAYGDFATGILAMLALLSIRIRTLFWPLVVAFNVIGTVDILVAYVHGIQYGLPAVAGQLGATYFVPVIYVPALMITHAVAIILLVRHRDRQATPSAA
jgi:hypothetical protein